MHTKRKRNTAGLGALVAVLLLCELAAATVLCGRMLSYTQAKFVNILPLTEGSAPDDTNSANTTSAVLPAPIEETSSGEQSGESADTSNIESSTAGASHPEFRMEAEAEIFRLSYDNESGKTTVIGPTGNTDKLIAPGTSNLYQFTLQNPGDVALDYTLTMEAYVTGTDLWIPVDVRVWDYTNKYLVGSADNKVDAMELNTVEESGELGAGRYATYNLEWEWPFEWENDEYDTMLGNLAVEEDLVLHIVIRTVAEYDEDPDDPNSGQIKPPQTGDDTNLVLLSLLCVGFFVGICVILFAFFKTSRKEKQKQAASV